MYILSSSALIFRKSAGRQLDSTAKTTKCTDPLECDFCYFLFLRGFIFVVV
jgi:hypothetical protein